MPGIASTEIRLASRPRGWPTPDNFSVARVNVPAPAEGQVLVRNLFMSVDPYMRGRMNDAKSYVPPFQVGQPLDGGAVGEIVESRSSALAAGDAVLSMRGWREYFVADAREVLRIDRTIAPLRAYIGILGTTGMTAWVGLKLAEIRAGDRLFVSAAAGAVGSVAGQLAKLAGCFVVGSAGSPEKVALLLDELGFDRAFNYKEGDLRGQLTNAAPEGLDVYFDNVGGDQLEAALAAMRDHGRIVACGAISRYNDTAPLPGPRNLFLVVTRRLTIKGFIVTDWRAERPAFLKEVGALLAEGKLRPKETIVEGLERAPQAFLDMMRGANVGKMVVKI
jgi:NADPH-dependent curcumin reductase CurA